ARTLQNYHSEFRVVLPRQGLRWRLCDAKPERMPDGSTLWHGIITDITERKRIETTLGKDLLLRNILLELYQKAATLEGNALYEYFLDQAVRLTDSQIGFFHIISENQQEVALTSWNKGALKGCTVVHDQHYPLGKAGNWVDCVRQKRPLIYNDFPASPNQKGLPEGHTPLSRILSLPVIEGDKVRYIFGVGNKALDYDQHDIDQIQLLANEMLAITKRKRAEFTLMKNERLRAIGEGAAGTAHDVNNSLQSILGLTNLTQHEVQGLQ
ncbi:MAG: GAF domain-containing protein, partial [Candidatus Margulisiibacteriota bacterium]